MAVRPITKPHIRSRNRARVAGVLLLLGMVMGVAPVAMADTPKPTAHVVKLTKAPPGRAIPGRYIVRLRPGGLTADVVIPVGVRPAYVYQDVVNGFTANMTPAQVNEVLSHPEVASVEEDGIIEAFEGPTWPTRPTGLANDTWAGPTLSWGLDRIDQRKLPLNHTFNVGHDGTGVTAYIVDSGIDMTNSEFTGRIAPGYSAISDGHGTDDCLGHGTFVAGIVGGSTWGVARKVSLVPVRVLGCDGSGSYSGIIAGFDWVARHAVKPAVVNASLGGSKSPAVNDATNGLSDSGVLVSVAAGNSFIEACDVSPASAPRAVTVGASTITDQAAIFSNTGPCVDLFAPGLDVTSAKKGGGIKVGSGTSYAAPYVAGVAALYKQAHGDVSSAVLQDWFVDSATSNVLAGVGSDTPNKLLFTNGL